MWSIGFYIETSLIDNFCLVISLSRHDWPFYGVLLLFHLESSGYKSHMSILCVCPGYVDLILQMSWSFDCGLHIVILLFLAWLALSLGRLSFWYDLWLLCFLDVAFDVWLLRFPYAFCFVSSFDTLLYTVSFHILSFFLVPWTWFLINVTLGFDLDV